MPHLEDDPLGGDPFDAFDSGDEEIPCGQRDNLAAMFDLAGTLETPVPAQVGEPRAPPAPRCLPQPRRPLWPALPQQSIWRCWWQRCGRLSHLLSHRLRWPSRWWLLVRPCRPCLIRWTLVRCWVRGRACVLPLHPRHRAKRDRGLDPVPDLVHILLRRRVRAGLRRPPLSSPISRRMSRPPPSGMRKP